MGMLLASESQVIRQMYNINQCSRPFLTIPCWLVLLPCFPPTDSWLLIIIPVETKRNLDLMWAAWAYSHVLPSNQSAKWVSCNREQHRKHAWEWRWKGLKGSFTKRKPGLTYSSSPAFGLSLSDGRSLKERLRRSLSKKASCRASKIVSFGLSCRGCSHFFNS